MSDTKHIVNQDLKKDHPFLFLFFFTAVQQTWEELEYVNIFFLVQNAGPGEPLLMKLVKCLIFSCLSRFTESLFVTLISVEQSCSSTLTFLLE